MARTQKEVAQEMVDAMNSNATYDALEILTQDEQQSLPNLTSTSRVSVWRLMVDVVAYTIAGFEYILDVFMEQAESRIAETRVHTKDWYRNLALSFQLGASYDVLTGYDNSSLTAAQIEAMKVVKYAAVTRLVQNNTIYLRIKTANEANGELIANTDTEIDALTDFIEDNADAGTLTTVSSGDGDDLKLVMTVHFDPQILDTEGKRLDGTNDTPVQEAIQAFLKSVEFNGRYIKRKNEDAITLVQGVELCEITAAASKYAQHDYTSTGIANAGVIDQFRVADSGYFKLDEPELVINYEPFYE